ncbi:MAG: IS110 family transposase [Planctomycetes bacterium]|nr:IS110 family transposase [Planctomycetota bacterium]
MTTLYIGVDVSKDTLDVAYWTGTEATTIGTFTNNSAGFDELSAQLVKLAGAQQICLVLEATGSYHLSLTAYATEQTWQVALPNPKRVKDWAKGMGYRAKHDKIDGRKLAHYGGLCKPPIQPPLPQELEYLDNLLKRQQDLEQLLRQERNRQHALEVRPSVDPQALASVERTIAFLAQELETINQAINTFFNNNPERKQDLKQLRQLPGIGPKNAPHILLLLYRWDNLTGGQGSAKQLTAFVGLDPEPHSSGTSVYKRPAISKMGDGHIRSLLYMGALGGVRGHNPLRNFYQAMVNRGKAKKLALVASARKILVWAWTCFSRNVDFDPTKIDPNFS